VKAAYADQGELAAAFNLTDSDMEVEAERIAGQVHRMAALLKGQATQETSAIRFLRSLARKHHVELPSRDGFTHTLNRMGDAAWWSSASRRRPASGRACT
jgi:hypothetical protein